MLSHVVLSMDITRKSHLKSRGGLDMGICLKYSSPAAGSGIYTGEDRHVAKGESGKDPFGQTV